MSTRTENLKLRVDFRSPDTILSQRTELDENFNLFDDDYPLIFEGLEGINELFSKVIKLKDDDPEPEPPTPEDVLPDEYIKLQYLSGNANTYFNTGYLCKINSRFILKISYPQNVGSELVPFGTYWWYNQYGLSVQPSSGHLNFRWHAVGNNGVIAVTSNGATNDDYEIECGNGYFVLENNKTEALQMTTFNEGPLTIGDVRQNYSGYYFTGKFYYFNIYEDTQPIHRYVPCKQKDTNIVGFYDFETQVFSPATAGNFIAGPEAN